MESNFISEYKSKDLDYRIVIPSRKRSDVILDRTLSFFADATVVVRHEEKEDYESVLEGTGAELKMEIKDRIKVHSGDEEFEEKVEDIDEDEMYEDYRDRLRAMREP